MKISHSGLNLIKKYEGLILEPYLDAVGVPTIGYGNTFYENGKSVKITDDPITKDRAEELLLIIVDHFAKGVIALVKVELNQFQFDALVSFAYNVGLGALGKSTLLKRVNSNPFDADICHQFERWNKADGKVLLGLTRRRKEEAALYFNYVEN